MNFILCTVFLFLQQKVLFWDRCKTVLELKHLCNSLLDKYLERLKKIKGVANTFNQTLFNSTSSFLLFLTFIKLVVIQFE